MNDSIIFMLTQLPPFVTFEGDEYAFALASVRCIEPCVWAFAANWRKCGVQRHTSFLSFFFN